MFYAPLEVTHRVEGEDDTSGFAVVRINGTQYKVTDDDVIVAAKLPYAVGDRVWINDVLMLGSLGKTVVGRPTIPGAKVRLTVEEQTKDQKLIVSRKKSKAYKGRVQGHRREVTLLRVEELVHDEQPWPSPRVDAE